jgi:SAM-dependent methyltransferase
MDKTGSDNNKTREYGVLPVWEDMVALNTRSELEPKAIGSASEYRCDVFPSRFESVRPLIDEALERDKAPLPDTLDREGYYGPQHFNYWLSGLKDYQACMEHVDGSGITLHNYMDFGGATGRVLRHFAAQQKDLSAYCCDLNLNHVRWVNRFLPISVAAIQSTSLPQLPFEDNSLDLVTAFSVFSHLESFDHAWILEIRRILRPGGLFIFTANVDNWQDVNDTWPVFRGIKAHPDFKLDELGKPLLLSRKIFRWHANGSYSSTVFLRSDYVEREWARLMKVVAIEPYFTQYQTGIVLRK